MPHKKIDKHKNYFLLKKERNIEGKEDFSFSPASFCYGQKAEPKAFFSLFYLVKLKGKPEFRCKCKFK